MYKSYDFKEILTEICRTLQGLVKENEELKKNCWQQIINLADKHEKFQHEQRVYSREEIEERKLLKGLLDKLWIIN